MRVILRSSLLTSLIASGLIVAAAPICDGQSLLAPNPIAQSAISFTDVTSALKQEQFTPPLRGAGNGQAPASVGAPASLDAPKLAPDTAATAAPSALPEPVPPQGQETQQVQALPFEQTSADANAQAPKNFLRYLPNNAQGLRLAGEIATSEWPIYFTKNQASQALQFQLGYLAAISDLPEASRLSVEINDVEIGHIQIDAPNRAVVTKFNVPPDLVKQGFNSLRIIAQQRHRADCSLSATFELWTQIDATKTGFIIPKIQGEIESLADLPAVPPDRQGATPIRAILPAETTAAQINRTFDAIQLAAIRGRFEQPLVHVDSSPASGAGLNVAVGTYGELASVPGLSLPAPGSGPKILLQDRNANQRPVLIVTGDSASDLDKDLTTLSHYSATVGSPSGLRAARAFPGYAVTGGTRVKLRDLGVISQEFSGRMFRTSFHIIMPSDFYPADIANVNLDLAGAYAPDLSSGAQIVISVNDKIAVGSPLSHSNGELFKGRRIGFPLGMLQPGLNKITIEAQVGDESDKKCEPWNEVRAQKRFLLLDDSELIIPGIARVALSPNLAVTATGGFPYANLKAPPHLYVPKPDPETLSATATVIARMAVSAGRMIDFRLVTQPPRLGDGAALLIGAANSFSSEALKASGLDPRKMAKIWNSAEFTTPSGVSAKNVSLYARQNAERVALERNFPARCQLQVRPRGAAQGSDVSNGVEAMKAAIAQSEQGPQGAAPLNINAADGTIPADAGSDEHADMPENLAQKWQSKIYGGPSWMPHVSLPSFNPAIFGDIENWGITQVKEGKARIFAGLTKRDEPSVIQDSASLLMAQESNDSSGNAIWTIVTAPTEQALSSSVACLVDPRVWNHVRGAISALNTAKADIASNLPENPHFISTQAFSIFNMRLIAAGWFSQNVWAFIATVLSTGLILGIMTRVFVRNVGRRL
ncbi:MAG: cellulose biosynthesis cyclic di-GMP-binding regulatory protein BcsB [Hyphomicrobiales bacterium]|nr:cellulose biosynthesis cyclic di-GMP-binding regulatory protein BcsB [Hyphomicrobiales bacterium]